MSPGEVRSSALTLLESLVLAFPGLGAILQPKLQSTGDDGNDFRRRPRARGPPSGASSAQLTGSSHFC